MKKFNIKYSLRISQNEHSLNLCNNFMIKLENDILLKKSTLTFPLNINFYFKNIGSVWYKEEKIFAGISNNKLGKGKYEVKVN